MSRIGRKPISVPSGVKVTIDGRTVTVVGPKGTLSRELPGAIAIAVEGETLQLSRPSDSKTNRSLHGLCRTLVA
ncbi:MAG: 50S ribosomal protein L6, partial [Candidatus Limnocylindrus sp.]